MAWIGGSEMTFKELNREQIIQLKQAILCERAMDEGGFGSPSWGGACQCG